MHVCHASHKHGTRGELNEMWLRGVHQATHAHSPADTFGSLAVLPGVLFPRLLLGEKVQETGVSYI